MVVMAVHDLFRTFDEAHHVDAYELARRWADTRRPGGDRPVEYELDELATMAALADWLTRWLPIHIHQALLGGASLEDVATATGLGVGDVVHRWVKWSDGQRRLWARGGPGVRDRSDEHDRVAALIEAEVGR